MIYVVDSYLGRDHFELETEALCLLATSPAQLCAFEGEGWKGLSVLQGEFWVDPAGGELNYLSVYPLGGGALEIRLYEEPPFLLELAGYGGPGLVLDVEPAGAGLELGLDERSQPVIEHAGERLLSRSGERGRFSSGLSQGLTAVVADADFFARNVELARTAVRPQARLRPSSISS